MVAWWWSYLLMAVGVTGLYLSGSKKAYGWLIGLGAQVLWLAYGVSTHQYGFIISCAFYGSVYGRNYLRWRREQEQRPVNKHVRYLWYVLRHKLYVYREGRKLGVSRLQLLLHDWQKFTPAEWFPYVRYFYGDYPVFKDMSPGLKMIYFGRTREDVERDFDYAWLHHQKLGGKHHWQYWLLRLDSGITKALYMPDRYRREMLADWRGAGLALGKPDTAGWYEANRDKMQLHPETRAWIEQQLYGEQAPQ